MMTHHWIPAFFLKNVCLLGMFRAFGFFDFLILVGILLVLIVFVFSSFHIIKFLIKRQETMKLMEEKILPEIASKFGKLVSLEVSFFARSLSFERNESLFELKVKPIFSPKSNNFMLATVYGTDECEYRIQFTVPNLREKFYIGHKSFFRSNYPADCQEVQVSMPDDFIFHSLNPGYLLSLMEKEKVRQEMYKYQKKFSRPFNIAFENGVFTVTWHRGPSDGEFNLESVLYGDNSQIESQKLEQICQTAVVFHDEIVALLRKS